MNRPSRSRRLLAWGGLAGTLLAAGVGCSSTDALIRGQSPDGAGVARAADFAAPPVIRAQSPDRAAALRPKPSHNTKLVSHEGVPVSSGTLADGTVVGHPSGYCPPDGAYCPPGHHGVCMPGIPCPGIPCPAPHLGLTGHTYTYRDPGVPVYPPGTGPALTGPGSPGAVVQYPYYTTKGPDDFFLDQDGRF
ncbi:MAG TPA: hypothetical protein VF170_16930 [Planctomycetaceae bacterium]